MMIKVMEKYKAEKCPVGSDSCRMGNMKYPCQLS